MPALFYLPKVASLPGSKLYFYRTGTSTPQDVFTDADLSVAHSQPVVADASGVFAPIYLDQTDYDYRVSHYTSADVLIYTVDDVPNNLGDGRNITISSVTPFLELWDTDGGTNEKRVRIAQQGGDFQVTVLSDDGGTESTAFKIFRTGANIDKTTLYGDSVSVVVGGNEFDVAITSDGSFTGTLTGMTATVTGTFYYRKVNNLVHMWCASNITGTSNTTAMTLTGLPSAIQPTVAKIVMATEINDNGITKYGIAQINAGPSITFGLFAITGSYVGVGAFTNSGTKGLGTGWSITYSVD